MTMFSIVRRPVSLLAAAVLGLTVVATGPIPRPAAAANHLAEVRPTGDPGAEVTSLVGPVNPVAPALSFGVMTEGNANVVNDENEGTMAVGGDLSFGNYQLAGGSAGSFVVPGDANPTALVVGGRVNFAASVPGTRLQVLQNGYAKVGDLTGTFVRDLDNNQAAVNTRILPSDNYDAAPRVELVTRQPVSSVGPTSPINFAAAFTSFRSTATDLATCDNTVVLRDPNGNLLPSPIPAGSNAVVTLTPGVTNVLNISATDLSNIAILTFANQPTADTPLLVNVDTTGVGNTFNWTAPNFAGVGGNQARFILLNFPTATTLTLTPGAATVEGTIYAPNANLLDQSASNTEGSIITSSFDHRGGEVHYFPFSTTLSCGGALVASISVVKTSTTVAITQVGQQVPYSFMVVNTGGLTLTNVNVTDVQTPPSSGANLGPITCLSTTLAPGVATTCSATYTVTQADLDNDALSDTATAHGTPPGTTTPVDSAPARLTIPSAGLTGSISMVKSSTTTTITSAGQQVPYSFLVVNTGGLTLTNVTVTDTLLPPSDVADLGPVTCGPNSVPNGTATLAPGISITCVATYTVSAADIASGMVSDVATATGTPPFGPAPVSPQSTVNIPVVAPSISIAKSVAPTTVAVAGDVVTYRFLVTNTGDTALTSVTVQETAFTGTGDLGPITCGTPPVNNGQVALAVGASTTCTATYRTTQADIDAGTIRNTAIAIGTPPTVPGQPTPDPVRSDPSSARVTVKSTASITVTKSSTTKVIKRSGERVTYSFVVVNTGRVTLTGVTVTDRLIAPAAAANLGPITCGPAGTPNGSVTLAPGATITCTAVYTVSRADYHHGSVRNVATATGTPPSGPAPVSPESAVKIPVKKHGHPLPVTGTGDLKTWITGGLLLLLIGAVLVTIARRRRAVA